MREDGGKVNAWAFFGVAFVLAGLTCWLAHLDPLPDWQRGRDPGWLVNLALGYFVVLLLGREVAVRLRR